MKQNNLFREIIQAIVTIPKLGGRGVLVPGNVILTAAHCIGYGLSGGMVLGDYYIEEIETIDMERLKVSPLAIEPVCDIAALGALDEQVFPGESMLFDKFCEKTRPAPLCSSNYQPFEEFQVFVYGHNGIWIAGRAEFHPPWIWIETEQPIKGGASGGPIVNEAGELVSICSNFTEVNDPQKNKSNGHSAFINSALPVWLHKRINEQA